MGVELGKQRQYRKTRAMALVSVLMVTVILLALAGAFFVTHKADLALLGSSTYREQTKNACLSIADFLQYKLQNDRTFGSKAFSRDGSWPKDEVFPGVDGEPLIIVEYRGKGMSPRSNRIHGHMPTSEVDFEVKLINNLSAIDTNTAAQDPEDPDFHREAPPHSVRAWITARRGNVTAKIDVIFKMSPFTNASITSGKDITVDLANAKDGYWLLGAMQPSGNAVRAKGTITGPEVWSKTGKAVRFLPPPGMADKLKPPYGVLQGQILNMQVDGVHRQLRAGTQTLEEAETNIAGVLSPGSGAIKVPELARDDLQGAAVKSRFPYSELVFRTVQTESGPVHRLDTGQGEMVAEYKPTEHETHGRLHPVFGDNGQKIAIFDLENRVMMVEPNIELQVPGDFTLRSKASNPKGITRQPTLILGNSQQGSSIDASSITIEGSLGGYGALKSSKGNVEIAAKSTLSTTPDYGIALHAEKDVVLTKPGTNASDGLAVDWDAFRLGVDSGSEASNQNLRRWGYLSEEDQSTEANRIKDRVLAQPGELEKFQVLWDGLTADFPADQKALDIRDAWLKEAVPEVTGDDPTWVESPEEPVAPKIVIAPAQPPGPGITLEKYVRMREYLRTLKEGTPDPSWLDSVNSDIDQQRSIDVTKLVKNQLSSYQLSAGQITREVNGQPLLRWKPLTQYFKEPNPFTATYSPDMQFRGLVYAKRDFIFDTERNGVYIEGGLVAQGNIRIENATGAHFVYNSDLLQNLFATDELDLSIPLKKAYWAYY